MDMRPNTFTYFMRPVGMKGPVKIGCSYDPGNRLEEYSRWSPLPLEIVARIRGTRSLELQFHAKFADLWSHFEWFSHSDEMERVIDAINAGTFDVNTLPAAIQLHSLRKARAAK